MNGQLVIALLNLVAAIILPHWLVRWDERRLDATRRGRSWNDASHWAAVVAFNWLAVPVHFGRTRRSFWGAAVGSVWAVAGIVGQIACSEALAAALR